jgi:hypothetical protein
MLKFFLPVALSAVLVACGGGGGSQGTPAAVTPVGSANNSSISSASFSSASSVSQASSSSSVSEKQVENNALIPQGIYAIRENNAATLYWDKPSGSLGYNVYVASEADIAPDNIDRFINGRAIKNVQPPYTVSNLANGQQWYLVVTSVNVAGESLPGQEVRVIPSGLDPALEPTPQEVLVIELINRARANPQAEAEFYDIGLNDGIDDASITEDSKQPLALNTMLQTAARDHSQWMLNTNIFSHTGIDDSTPSQRNKAAGYVLKMPWRTGENISVIGPAIEDAAGLTTMAIRHHQNLFKSPGHRRNILNGDFRNIGVGQKVGNYTFGSGNTYYSSMLTQSYAKSGAGFFLTGVAYQDINNNNFYDVGEALSDITLEIDGKFYQVFSSGAYSVPLPGGTYTVTIHGDSPGLPIQHAVVIGEQNVKLDIVKTQQGIVIR